MGASHVLHHHILYCSKAIDLVGQGLTGDTKAAVIVTNEYADVGEAIQERLGRMITNLYGKGGYKEEDKEVIFVVLTRLEIAKLKSIVYETDPKAFITIIDAQEDMVVSLRVPFINKCSLI